MSAMGLVDGVRILDLSRTLAGPCGSMLTADLGAERLKIEDPGLEVKAAPLLGERTHVALRGLLGYPSERLEALRARKAAA